MVTRLSIVKMMQNVPNKPILFVPAYERTRILRLYSEWCLEDFDINYNLNRELGAVYPTSFDTVRFYMNMRNERELIQLHYNRLGRQGLKDGFNLVQSAVRSRLGERFWCDSVHS